MVTQELIEKFFKQECTDEERDFVLEYFETNPEALGGYLDEYEWQHFKEQDKMDPVLSKKIFLKVRRRTLRREPVRNLKRIGIAASILVVIALVWLLAGRGDDGPKMAYEKKAAPVLPLIARENTSERDLNILLDDGSVVTLAPHSKIKYHKPFDVTGKRIVYLEGQALFNVAKDKSKPFSVYSDALVTTALGTSFTVKAFSGKNFITVLLHEGRVVVRPAVSLTRKLKKDFFLSPGDRLMYNKTLMTASIEAAGRSKHKVALSASPQKEPAVIVRPDWYKFDGMPLDKVIEQLQVYYNVDIRCAPDDMRNKYFTVRIDKSDSIENILNDIALLNDFILTKKDGIYFLLKK